MTGISYEGRITLGNIITIATMVVASVLYFARIETKNAVQDEQLKATRASLSQKIDDQARTFERSIAMENEARREALQELRIRVDADRAEMRSQFERLNAKIDKLIQGSQ